MAVKPSNAALTALRNTRREKQEELGRAYTAMGGSNTALLANPTIPKLERAINNLYQSAQSGGRETYGDLQAMSGTYNDVVGARTDAKLKNIKQESLGQLVSQPTIMGMTNNMYGNLTPEMQSAGITLDDLKKYNAGKSRRTYEDVASQIGAEHPVIATGLAAAEQPLMSLGNVAKNVRNYALGNPIENNFNPATALRQSVAENNIDTKVGNFAYGVGNSMVDMLIASLAGANAGPGIMGLEKADQVMNSAVDRGLTPNQIMAEGVGSGITTGLTEMIPFREFKAGDNILRSMRNEGIQEGAEDIADTLLDYIVTQAGGNPEKSEYNLMIQAYRDAGYSEEEAKNAALIDYLKQLGLDSLAGAIAGGGMGAIGNVSQGYNAFTGRPRTNAETESNVTADAEPETIPTLRDSRAEESAIQEQRNAELAQLTEAVAQMREQQNAQQTVPQVQNYDPEEMEYLRNTLLDANSLQINPENVRTDNQTEQPNTNWVTHKLTGKPASKQFMDALNRLESGDMIDSEEYNAIPEVIDAKKRLKNGSSFDDKSPEREAIRNDVAEKLWNMGSAVLDENGKTQYSGVVNKDRRADLIFGLSSSGKSSTLVDPISNYYKSRLIDSDEAKKMLPGYDDGWGATYVHSESKDVATEVLYRALADGENIVIPKVGDDFEMIKGLIDQMHSMGYEVYIHFNDLPPAKAAGRNLRRFADDGRFVDLDVTSFKYGNKPAEVFERLIKEGGADGYSKVSNDVKRGEQSIFLGGTENIPEYQRLYRRGRGSVHELSGKETSRERSAVGGRDEKVSVNPEKISNAKDINNIQTPEEAATATYDEIEKLDRATHRMTLDLFAEKGGEQEIPQVKDNGVHTGNYKTSKFATNSFPNSGTMTEEEYNRVIPDEIRRYETVTHEATLNKAEENLKSNGYTGEYNRLLNDKEWDAVDVDTAMLCAAKCADEARNAEALGVESEEAWKREVAIFKKARSMATAGGQMIEAFKKWSAMTPEGKLGQAIAHINETVTEDKNDLRLKKEAQTAADRLLTDEFMAEFLKKAHQYDGQEVSFAKQARLNAELAHMINEQIPVKFRQKFTSLWMDNLLASFRTLISRNFGGNIGKAALDQTLVKMFSGPIDNFISRYTGTRTTTGFTKEGIKTYWKGFRQGAGQTARDYWTPNADPDTKIRIKDLAKEIDLFADANVTNRPGVDETNFKETIKNNRPVFKNKAFKLYDKVIKFGLAFGDNPFYKGTYDQTIYELNTLREQGRLDLPEDITEEQYEAQVKAIATAVALEAVYQNNSELAQGATDIKNGLSKLSKGFIGFDMLSGASMPFVRTPMNVVKTNLELSPLGIVGNTLRTISEIRANLEAGRSAFDTTSFRQNRFVRETSRNLVGLILFTTGLMLKNAGLLTGGYSDDDREKQAQKESGMQEYALVNPFNGNQYSINWIPGLGSSLVSASAFEDAYNKPDQSTVDAILNGSKAGAQSLFEQAALQGLQRLTGSANYNTDNKIVDNAVQTIANTASSAAIPAFMRQIAAATDPYKRNTYGTGDKDYESVYNNFIAGIPYLRQTLQPRIGMNGQPMEQNAGRNGFEKWFDNLVNPAMVTVPSALTDPVRDEATRLYEATGSSSAYQPKIGINSLKTEDHTPTTEEYTEFLQIADSAMNQAASELIQSDYYAGLTDEQRVDTLNSIYTAVQSVEKARYLGTDKEFNGASKAYNEGGTQGLIDYFVAKNALAEMGAQNNPENRELITETMNNGTFDDMEQLGFDVNLIKRYQHAADRIPSLNPTSFQQQFNAIDTSIDETGNNSITQKEIIAYLNQNPTTYSEEDAMKIWDAYLQSYGKIPVFDPNKGTWSAK